MTCGGKHNKKSGDELEVADFFGDCVNKVRKLCLCGKSLHLLETCLFLQKARQIVLQLPHAILCDNRWCVCGEGFECVELGDLAALAVRLRRYCAQALVLPRTGSSGKDKELVLDIKNM